jgi:hypothetical protein
LVDFLRPPTQSAGGQQLQALMRQRQAPFNLHRRSFTGLTTASHFLLPPSGIVPGGGEEGHCSRHVLPGGIEGPDCTLVTCFRVYATKVEDHFPNCVIYEVFFVNYTAPLLFLMQYLGPLGLFPCSKKNYSLRFDGCLVVPEMPLLQFTRGS